MGPINNDRPFPTFLCYYRGYSPPNPIQFALRSLEGMRCWDNFEEPPHNGFGQAPGQPEAEPVVNWLQGIQFLSISIFFRWFIFVEHNRGMCTFDFLDHPAKRNVGQSMNCIARRTSSADICVLSAYHNWKPKFTKTNRNDTQRTIPLSYLSGRHLLVFLSRGLLYQGPHSDTSVGGTCGGAIKV